MGRRFATIDPVEEREMEAAKSSLSRLAPFYGTLLFSRLTMVQDGSCPTAWTDGRYIGYNPEFTKKLDHDRKVFLVAHEVDHVARKHFIRLKGRDPGKFNVAGDMIINYGLVKSGYTMIEGGLLASDAEALLSTEALYERLPDSPPGGGGGGGGGDGLGDHFPGGYDELREPTGEDGQELTPSELDELERQLDVDIIQAAQVAKRAGKLPGHVSKLVEEMTHTDADWREQLREFATEVGKNDTAWNPPNRRYVGQDLYLPSLRSLEVGEGWCIGDTSGSTYSVLPEFQAHLATMCEQHNVALNLLYVDAAVQGDPVRIEPGDEFVFECRGGGGTDFRPGFEWLEEQGIRPRWLVYLTDMYGTFPEVDPGFPVLWAVIGEWQGEPPPFGRVIHIRDI
jgi:predicted metal-dependent peptidase